MGWTVKFAALGIAMAGALWLALSYETAASCSAWNPFSCHGPDPELTRLVR